MRRGYARQMSVLVAFSVTPLGVGEGVGEIVAEAVRVVRESGLPNKTDSMFTVIEGDSWAEVMAVVERAVEAVAARANRVSVVIKADWRSGVTDAMTSKTRVGGAPPVEPSDRPPNVIAVSARAGIVVTGTEVLTGRVADRNGPWIADRLLELGVELAHITICGDRAADIEAQLRFMADEGVDLIVTSGGLGPTADDMTVATVARFCGRELVLDAELEDRIAEILKKLMARIRQRRFRRGARSQPQAGDGPGRGAGDRPGGNRPGRRRAGQADGRGVARSATRIAADVAGRGAETRRCSRRSPAERCIARTRSGCSGCRSPVWPRRCAMPSRAVPGFDRLEITTCLRRGEIEMVTRYEPDAADIYTQLTELLRQRHGRQIFSEDGSLGRRPSRAAAGRPPHRDGRILHRRAAGRPADRPAGFIGIRRRGCRCLCERGEDRIARRRSGLIAAHGAVSEPVAEAMADGALNRFDADTAIAITGIAGPSGRHG